MYVWNLSVGELSSSDHTGLLYETPIFVCWVKLAGYSVSGCSLKNGSVLIETGDKFHQGKRDKDISAFMERLSSLD